MQVKQVRKVRHQRRPGYPTRPEVARDPELLRRHVPSAWKKSAQVTAALSIMLASGCQTGTPPKSNVPAGVAPVFVHGEGRGVAGCVMVTPPVFISEEEARRLISDELAKVGLSMSGQDITLKRVRLPQVNCVGFDLATERPKYAETSFPLVIDLVDPAGKVAVEYISTGDYLELGGTPSGITVQGFECLDIAKKVRAEIRAARKAQPLHYGVFYDPMFRGAYPECPKPERFGGPLNREQSATWKAQCELAHAEFKKESLELLRAQVRDFIEWLKGQGAI